MQSAMENSTISLDVVALIQDCKHIIVAVRIVGRFEAYFKRLLRVVRRQNWCVKGVSRDAIGTNARSLPPTYLS